MSNFPAEIKLPPTSSVEVKNVVSDDRALERFLTAQVSLNDLGVYSEENCTLCSSRSRQEAEEKWLVSRDAAEIREFLRSEGESMPITVIKNHMEYHVDQSFVELRKREYISKLIMLTRLNLDTLGRVDMALSSISERLLSANAAEDPGLSPAELEKMRADATCKLIQAMTKLLELRANLMGEMKDSGDLLSIKQEDFANIFSEVLQEFTSEEVRRAINRILEKFAESTKKK